MMKATAKWRTHKAGYAKSVLLKVLPDYVFASAIGLDSLMPRAFGAAEAQASVQRRLAVGHEARERSRRACEGPLYV